MNSVSFLPPANEFWGKVIFSEACVKNSVHGEGGGVTDQQYISSCTVGGIGHMVPPGQAPPMDRHPSRAGTPRAGISPRNMVNERAVRILLECILVWLMFSVTRKEVEHSKWENTTAIAWEFLLEHPKHMQQYEFWMEYVENQKNAWRVWLLIHSV